MRYTCILPGALFLGAACSTTSHHSRAPETAKAEVVQDFFGTKVADPYRWLEDANDPATKAWVGQQNQFSSVYLKSLPERADWLKRLTEVSNYEKYTSIVKADGFILYAHNSGLQNQAVWYMTRSLDQVGTPILDPNAWDPAGGLSIPEVSLSPDGRWLAYAVSSGGSDWRTWQVLDLKTRKPTADSVKWSKFSDVVWSSDSRGFYYTRFAEAKEDQKLTVSTHYNAVNYHRLGTDQKEDTLVFEMKSEERVLHFLSRSTAPDYLVINTRTFGNPNNRIHVKSLAAGPQAVQPVLTRNDAIYQVVGGQGDELFVVTDNGAPRRRLVQLSLKAGANPGLKTLIPEPEGRDSLKQVLFHRGSFITVVRHDVLNQAFRYDRSGQKREPLTLPTLGALNLMPGSSDEKQDTIYAEFVGYLQPSAIVQLNMDSEKFMPVWKPRYAFDADQFVAQQVFYPSKDGTLIPMTILTRKDRPAGKAVPMILTGYGGFRVALEPRFSANVISWLERGGGYALANLRGGDEYGSAWYDAGRLFNKQNVFDDFIAAGEYLVREKYSSPGQLGIEGRSNGGLLVGAAMTQRPDLFAAVVPTVGVLDMLRFHLFTVGGSWTTDYLTPDDPGKFAAIMKYSPLHNLQKGEAYPATLVLTGDHDDRVVPAHSYKFTAALQAAQGGSKPVLIRIETNVGHGAGAPIQKRIAESADVLSFLSLHLGLK